MTIQKAAAWLWILWMLCVGLVPETAQARQVVTGAQVNEEAASIVLYVDGNSAQASDANSGTQSQPLKTLGEAVSRANVNDQRGKGTKVIVAQGTYRENINIGSSTRANGTPLVLECVAPGACTVSGSEIYKGWTSHGSGIYSHAWRFNWGLSRDPWVDDSGAEPLTDMARRREIVFVKGKLMRQYLSYQEMSGAAGSYFVDEGADKIYVHAPSGVDLQTATVEVAERATALSMSGAQNIVVRGFVFEHTANVVPNGSVFVGESKNIMFEDAAFVWNNWAGLKVWKTAGVTLRRVRSNDNGAMGMGGSKNSNLIFEDVEANRNNLWRGGEWGQNYKPWATAGMKWLSMQDAVMRRIETSYNGIHGLWFDWSNQRITIEDLTSCYNRAGAFFFEASHGPLTIDRALLCFNQGLGAGDSPGGLRITNSRDVTMRNSILFGNGKAQIYSPNRASSNVMRNGIRSGNWKFSRVVLVSTSSSDYIANVPWTEIDGEPIVTSIEANDNLYFHPDGSGTGSFHERASKTNKSFSQWKSKWSADARTLFEDPLFIDPKGMDFRLRAGSALQGWNLPTGRTGGGGTPGNTPPTVSIAAPTEGRQYAAPASIAIEADARDLDGRIVKVEFFAGATKVGEDASAPFSVVWTNVSAGRYNLTAVATDDGGAVMTSSPVTVSVVAPEPTARFTATPTVGTAPLQVSFDAANSSDADGSISSYSWDFGDGTQGSGVQTTHTYKAAGTFIVALTVRDNSGLTGRAQTTISVKEPGSLPDPLLVIDFDEGSGTVAKDASGNGHDGQLEGNPTWSAGRVGSALRLDGADDYVTVNSAPDLELTNALAIMGWFNHSASGGDPAAGIEKRNAYRILAKESNTAASHWIFDLWDANNNFHRLETNAAVPNDEWHHVAATFDGAVMAIYVDGVLAGSKNISASIAASGLALEIGRRDRSKYFSGLIDEVRIYNLPLSQTEIQALMSGRERSSQNQPPSVMLTSPTAGATLSAGANVTLQASAQDADGSVAKVEFFQGSTKLGEATAAPYTYTWRKVPEGRFTLSARAVDDKGAATTSAPVDILVEPGRKGPKVSIAKASLTEVKNLQIQAEASTTEGTIAKVEFFEGTTKLGEDATAPYSFKWKNVVPGSYTLVAKATDNAGMVTASAPISFTVEGGTQKLQLKQGWNLVSLNVAPANASMEQVLAAAATKVVLVKDEAGSTYAPDFGINGIGAWSPYKAYMILADVPLTFSVSGVRIRPVTTPLQLEKGWNFVPYLSTQALPIGEALASVKSDLVMVKDNEGSVYAPVHGINDIGNMLPGQGYKVYVERAVTLTYPAGGGATATATQVATAAPGEAGWRGNPPLEQ